MLTSNCIVCEANLSKNTPICLRITYHLTLCVLYACVHRQVCLFLKRGASQVEVDEDGQDPLSIAVQAANADIVTLWVKNFSSLCRFPQSAIAHESQCFCSLSLSVRLRLARMNEEMREADGPFRQPGQYPGSSPTEQQYRKCIQEFICLTIDEC